jgi:hypothetical protein
MTGSTQILLAAWPYNTVSNFTPWNVAATAASGTTAQARLNFLPDGTVTKTTTGTAGGSNGSSNWWLPTTAGVGSTFYVRFTATSGTWNDSTGGSIASGAWVAMGAGLFVGQTHTTLTVSCTFNVDIATDAAGANIIFRSTGNIVAITHT